MGARHVFLGLAASVVLTACGGSGGNATPPAPSIGTPDPGIASLGYAVTSGTNRVQPSTLEYAVYPPDTTTAMRTVPFLGGEAIRFDTLGTLWLDTIGSFLGTRPDGTTVGDIYGIDGSLTAFGPDDTLYAAAATELDAYRLAADLSTARTRAIPTTTYACSADGDAAGTVYIAPCNAAPLPVGHVWTEVDAYGPGASSSPTVRNTTATGPLTVGHDGTLYAMYAGSIGVWPAGTFSAGAPARTIPIPAGFTVSDIAADRSGNVYAVDYLSGANANGRSGSVLYVAGGSGVPVTLLSGAFGYITTLP